MQYTSSASNCDLHTPQTAFLPPSTSRKSPSAQCTRGARCYILLWGYWLVCVFRRFKYTTLKTQTQYQTKAPFCNSFFHIPLTHAHFLYKTHSDEHPPSHLKCRILGHIIHFYILFRHLNQNISFFTYPQNIHSLPSFSASYSPTPITAYASLLRTMLSANPLRLGVPLKHHNPHFQLRQ